MAKSTYWLPSHGSNGASGLPALSQELLGHSNIRLTMDIYTEIDTEQKVEAVNALPTCRELAKQKFQVLEGVVNG